MHQSPRRSPSQTLARWCLLAGAALFFRGHEVAAQHPTSGEYQVKAVYLYNFAHFVCWPHAAFPKAQTPVIIGVLGDDPFGAYLDETVRDERINDRRLVVRRFRQPEEIKNCHVLFISQSESKRLEAILTALRGKKILTVGDGDCFARNCAIIRFVAERNRVQFKIDVAAARTEDLTISSKLLRAAEFVDRRKL